MLLTFSTRAHVACKSIRCNYKDGLGITRKLGEICEANGVSIFSMLQKSGVDSFVILTDECKSSDIKKVAEGLSKEDWCIDMPFMMPIVSP